MPKEELNEEIQPAEPQDQIQEPTYSDMELKAMEMGWRPKDEWKGEEDDFIDAKNFVRNKSLFDKIDQLNRKVKDQSKALTMLQEHHAKVEEATRKQVISELKRAKKDALEEGDADKVVEIDDEIAKQRALEAYENTQAKQSTELHPEFVSWVETNSWYVQDPSMRQEADILGLTYKQLNPDKEPSEVLDYVAKQIKRNNPDKFKNPNRDKPTRVAESASQRAPSKSVKDDDVVLSDEERRVMNTFVRQNLMTKEEYIAEVRKMRGAQ